MFKYLKKKIFLGGRDVRSFVFIENLGEDGDREFVQRESYYWYIFYYNIVNKLVYIVIKFNDVFENLIN